MDGNGRWAARRRRPRVIGHRAGARTVNLCIDFCLERGIAALTLFAFSSENWGRPEDEVGALMKLFMGALDREVGELHRRGVRLRFIGERERFGDRLRQRMAAAEALTAGNTALTLSVAASYGGRQDIANAARALAAEVAAGHNRHFDARVIPSVAYTDPEVAWVGMTETTAKAQGIKVGKGVFPWAASGRSLALGRSEGITKVIFDETDDRVIGACIVGPNAGDLIAEVALAIEMGADAVDLGHTIHPHPTLSETVNFAAEMFEGTITDLIPPKKRH